MSILYLCENDIQKLFAVFWRLRKRQIYLQQILTALKNFIMFCSWTDLPIEYGNTGYHVDTRFQLAVNDALPLILWQFKNQLLLLTPICLEAEGFRKMESMQKAYWKDSWSQISFYDYFMDFFSLQYLLRLWDKDAWHKISVLYLIALFKNLF